MPSGPTKGTTKAVPFGPTKDCNRRENKSKPPLCWNGIEAKKVLTSAQKSLSWTATVLEGLSGECLSSSASGSPLHGLSCIENEGVGAANAFHLSHYCTFLCFEQSDDQHQQQFWSCGPITNKWLLVDF